MTLVISTKITWWLTNHRVGQPPNELASYVGKVAYSMGFTGNVSAIRTVLWVSGKWTSTVSALSALNIPGIVNAGDDKSLQEIKISASSDMQIRLTANPAGTAGTVTYHAIGKKAEKMVLGALLPVPLEWQDVENSVFDAVGRRNAV
jgi:hypothetical protein